MKRLLLVPIFLLGLLLVGCNETKETSYQIEGEYREEDKTFSGSLDLTYYNDTGVELTDLLFNLYGNAYREGAKNPPLSAAYHSAYYNKIDYGSMKIEKIEGGKEWEVTGEDDTLLKVSIDPLKNGEKLQLSIDFSTTLAKVNHRLGVGENAVNLANFYPILCVYEDGWQPCPYTVVGDPFYSEVASYDVKITFPASYSVATSGEQTVERKGEQKTVHAEGKLRDFALVLSERWTEKSTEVNGTLLTYYSMGEGADEYLELAKRAYAFFDESFGSLSKKKLSIVETDFPFGGMEYDGLVMLNSQLEHETMRYAIVHEIAHQWWYEGVGSDQRNSAWMDEGLAEYSTVLFFEQGDETFTRQGVVSSAKKAIRSYTGIYSQLFGKTNTSPCRNNSAFQSEYEYTNLVYNQGILLFDSLRESIGEKRFLSSLRDYFTAYRGKIAKESDLIGSFFRLGVDVDGLFQSFLQGKAII